MTQPIPGSGLTHFRWLVGAYIHNPDSAVVQGPQTLSAQAVHLDGFFLALSLFNLVQLAPNAGGKLASGQQLGQLGRVGLG